MSQFYYLEKQGQWYYTKILADMNLDKNDAHGDALIRVWRWKLTTLSRFLYQVGRLVDKFLSKQMSYWDEIGTISFLMCVLQSVVHFHLHLLSFL